MSTLRSLAISIAITLAGGCQSVDQYDLWIRGGTVIDGTGAPQRLADVASELGKPFEDVLIDDIGPRGASGAYFVMDEELQRRLLEDPYCSVSSDGSPSMRHPRGYGTFARVIRDYVTERQLLTIEEAVFKMSGLTAETVGIHDRGRITEGAAADLLVFDPENVADRATFESPFELAVGFDDVIVNGVAVRRAGEFTGRWPGRALRRSGD